MANVTKEQNFKFCLFLINLNLNLNSPMELQYWTLPFESPKDLGELIVCVFLGVMTTS